MQFHYKRDIIAKTIFAGFFMLLFNFKGKYAKCYTRGEKYFLNLKFYEGLEKNN